jgi:predicted nucleic acid-binding protein
MRIPVFVIDASVILSWLNPGEKSEYADKILEKLREISAITPALCCIEVNNILRLYEKRELMTAAETEQAVGFISRLPIMLDETPASFNMARVSALSRRYDLTVYDACYLELAVRYALPLATLDKKLSEAAKREGAGVKI